MPDGLKIYFIRHGQTDWNAEWRLQGQLDIPINEKGRAQAKRNGDVLAGLLEDRHGLRYIASPLGRTRETMEIARRALGLPETGYDTDDRLKEIHFGEWQGQTWDELRAATPDAVAARVADPWNWVAPGEGGESYAMLSDRARAWLDGVSEDTVVVSHGGINRCLRGILQGLSPDEIAHLKVRQDKIMAIQNCAVSWI